MVYVQSFLGYSNHEAVWVNMESVSLDACSPPGCMAYIEALVVYRVLHRDSALRCSRGPSPNRGLFGQDPVSNRTGEWNDSIGHDLNVSMRVGHSTYIQSTASLAINTPACLQYFYTY